ncbi:MAG: 3-phosphoglycerate dehydrogenase [Rubellimicrobium sp.]|nr:3-phosphoglycerate dehydrogenase [Rubellimicrobium sp.]
MAHVVVAGRIHPDAMALLEGAPGLTLEVIGDPGAALPTDLLARADALLIRYGVLHEAQVREMPRLRVVSRHGVGCDNLPVAALAARGVPVTIVGAVNAVSVAEQVLAMLMALVRRIGPYDAAVRAGNWAIRDSLAVGELAGRRLLLLGFGRIGREVARRAAAFDMEVLVHDPFVDDAAIAATGCHPVADWRAALPEIDAISLHLPASPETMGIIGAAELARMKPRAVLVNAARGGLVDEAALHAALTGHMAAGGAALDCFAQEPPPADLPLLSLPNVVLSPHSAALSAETARRMGIVAAQNVLAGLAGTLDPALVFNLGALREAGHGV